jgi:hypothetical protein
VFTYNRGVRVSGCDLWLDPTLVRAEAVISHAHSDHVRRHAAATATSATAALVLERYSRRMQVTVQPFGVPFTRGSHQITLYPAGHVLGSAQVLVDDGSRRLLYTGDLRLRPSRTAEPVEIPSADVLIIDSTFGHRRYVFPPDDAVVDAIIAFCEQAFAAGATPVLLAYSLGKAQEAVAHLHQRGLAVAVHRTVAPMNAIYRAHGVVLPDCQELSAPLAPRTAVVAPPQARREPAIAALGRTRTAMLTGWAMDGGARFRYRTDAAFPLSDHCGFDDLLSYVEQVGAREVHTVFGFDHELAAELRLRGIDAFPAGRPAQLALPGLM